MLSKNSFTLAKNLSLYFSQYIKKMYSEYLTKLAMKKQNAINAANNDVPMDVDGQTEEQRQQILREYEMEETKEEKAKSMKSGEKYIIKKLIQFKINIPKIDDYIQKLETLEVKQNYTEPATFGANNMNQFKTFQGFNDDSQIVYQNQNNLFNPQMSQPNPYMAMTNQMVNGLQNLNLDGNNLYWNNQMYQQPTNSSSGMTGNGNFQQYSMGQVPSNQNYQGYLNMPGN